MLPFTEAGASGDTRRTGAGVAGFWQRFLHGRPMTTAEADDWGRTRRGGRWRFVLAQWLPRGLALGAAVSVYRAGGWEAAAADWPAVLLTAVAVGGPTGLSCGLNIWSLTEAKFREAGR